MHFTKCKCYTDIYQKWVCTVSTNSLQSWTKVNVYWDRTLFIYQSCTIPYLLLWENLLQKNKFSCMFLHLYQSDLALYLSCLTLPSLHDWGGKKRHYGIHENKIKSPWKLHYMKKPSFLKKEGMFVILNKVGETFWMVQYLNKLSRCFDGDMKQMRYQMSW